MLCNVVYKWFLDKNTSKFLDQKEVLKLGIWSLDKYIYNSECPKLEQTRDIHLVFRKCMNKFYHSMLVNLRNIKILYKYRRNLMNPR